MHNIIFADLLFKLLKIYNVKNIKLALALNVDPSLISKWINGKRIPSASSHYINGIINYLLTLNIDKNEYKTVDLFVKYNFRNLNIQEKEVFLYKYIKNSISNSENLYLRKDNNSNKLYSENIKDLISKISVNNISQNSDNDTIKNFDNVHDYSPNNFHEKSFNFLFGTEGIKKALLFISYKALEFGNNFSIQMIFPNNLSLLLNDSVFAQNWSNCISIFLKRNIKIRIIFRINQVEISLINLFKFWAPFISSGKISFLYYSESNLPYYSFFIIPRFMGIYTFHAGLIDSKDCTLMIDSKIFLNSISLQFNHLKKTLCKPLFKYISTKNMKLFNFKNNLIKSPSIYLIKDGLSVITLDSNTYTRILNSIDLTKDSKLKRIEIHNSSVNEFKEDIKINPYREIYSTEILDIITNNKFNYQPTDFFYFEKIKPSINIIISHLENLIYMLNKYPNYEVAFLDKNSFLPFKSTFVLFRKRKDLLLSSWKSVEDGCYIYIDKNRVFSQIEKLYHDIWYNIPTNNKKKGNVIKTIEEKLKYLKNNYKVD
ncbi:MAG: helix-turn-helix transcriptional regulator [Clostridiales bacterium]